MATFFLLCQAAAAADVVLVLETPSAGVDCRPVCLSKDLDADCSGLWPWWGSWAGCLLMGKHSPLVGAESPADIFWEDCVDPPHCLWAWSSKSVHSAHTIKQKARSWQTYVSSWLLFWRNLGELVRFMNSYRLPALFCSASKCSFKLYFFFFEDSRFVSWWSHNLLYGWRK